jgi:hypothetical protein
MSSFTRTMERKQARKAMQEEDEQTNVEEEEDSDGDELSAEEIESMLYDAEALIRVGAEKIDMLVDAGVLDASVLDTADKVVTALCAKINKET